MGIAPRDVEITPTSVEFNTQLAELAESRGWEYLDALDFARAEGGGFVAGSTSDGIHLTYEAQQQLGEAVAVFLAG